MTRPLGTGQRFRTLRSQRRGGDQPATSHTDLPGQLGTLDHALAAVDQHPGTRHLRGHLETLAGAPARLLDVRKQFAAAREDAARQARDPNLSAAGRSRRERELIAAAQQRHDQAVGELRGQVDDAAAAVHRAATLPEPEPGVEPILARQSAWQRARQLLDAGMPVRQLLTEPGIGDDPETLHALADELPIYARARGASRDTAHQLGGAVEAQLAHVAGPETYARYAAHAAAEVAHAGLQPKLDNAHMAGALASRQAEQDTLARYQAAAADQPIGPDAETEA